MVILDKMVAGIVKDDEKKTNRRIGFWATRQG